jgi:hypothetical protein
VADIVFGSWPDREALDRLRHLLALPPIFRLAACLEPGEVFGSKGVVAILDTVFEGVDVEDPCAVCVGLDVAGLVDLLVPDVGVVGVGVVGGAVA